MRRTSIVGPGHDPLKPQSVVGGKSRCTFCRNAAIVIVCVAPRLSELTSRGGMGSGSTYEASVAGASCDSLRRVNPTESMHVGRTRPAAEKSPSRLNARRLRFEEMSVGRVSNQFQYSYGLLQQDKPAIFPHGCLARFSHASKFLDARSPSSPSNPHVDAVKGTQSVE